MAGDNETAIAGAASGGVRTLLRLEGVALTLASVVFYSYFEGSWAMFAILLLTPDLSFLGYLGGPRVGAAAYNTAHAAIIPMLLGIVGMIFGALAIWRYWRVYKVPIAAAAAILTPVAIAGGMGRNLSYAFGPFGVSDLAGATALFWFLARNGPELPLSRVDGGFLLAAFVVAMVLLVWAARREPENVKAEIAKRK